MYTDEYVRETLSATRDSVARWVQDVALKKSDKRHFETWDWPHCCKTVGLSREWSRAIFQHHLDMVSVIKASGRQRGAAAEPPVTTQPSFESQQLGASSQEEEEEEKEHKNGKANKAPQHAKKQAKNRSHKNGKGAEDYHNEPSGEGEDESKEEESAAAAAAVSSNARGRPTRHAAAAAANKIAANGPLGTESPTRKSISNSVS
jgi:hypothetical protein